MPVADIDVCDHGINVKYCQTCKKLAESKAPIQEKITKVMEDHAWHSLKDIALAIGVLTPDNACYNDIGRGLRLLRSPANGGHVVKKRYREGVYEYRVLPLEEQLAQPAQPAGKVNEKDEEIAFLKEYIANLEQENAELKRQRDFAPTETVKVQTA